MLNKAFGKSNKVTNYHCNEVGIPIFIFSISPLVVMIIITIIIVLRIVIHRLKTFFFLNEFQQHKLNLQLQKNDHY